MFQLCLHLLYLGSHVYHVAQRHCIFQRAHHEGCCSTVLLCHDVDARQVGHLANHAVVVFQSVFTYTLQRECLFVGDVFLVAHCSHSCHDLLHALDVFDKFHVFACRS